MLAGCSLFAENTCFKQHVARNKQLVARNKLLVARNMLLARPVD